ncbi:MAG: hypothetical protein ACN2B6_00820 [Rickettsiales bacterium]
MTIVFQDAVSEQVPTSSTLLYTAPSNVLSAIISMCNVTCEDALGSSVTINIVKNGDSASLSNRYAIKSIAATTSEVISEVIGLTLKAGDFISVSAADADRLNLKMTIKEIT